MLLKNNELEKYLNFKSIIMPESLINEFKSTTSIVPSLSFGNTPIRGDIYQKNSLCQLPTSIWAAEKTKLNVAQIVSEFKQLKAGQAKIAHDLSKRKYNNFLLFLLGRNMLSTEKLGH